MKRIIAETGRVNVGGQTLPGTPVLAYQKLDAVAAVDDSQVSRGCLPRARAERLTRSVDAQSTAFKFGEHPVVGAVKQP